MNTQTAKLSLTLASRTALVLLVALVAACANSRDFSSPPDLPPSTNLVALTYNQVDEPIAPYVITNSGGALSSCHTEISNPLPKGLQVELSRNRQNCVITGAPDSLEDALDYPIYAVNPHGFDSVVVSIGRPDSVVDSIGQP